MHLLSLQGVSAQRCFHPDAQGLLRSRQQVLRQSQTRLLRLWNAQRRAARPEAAAQDLTLQLMMRAPAVKLQGLYPCWGGLHNNEELHNRAFAEVLILYRIKASSSELKGKQQSLQSWEKVRQGGSVDHGIEQGILWRCSGWKDKD